MIKISDKKNRHFKKQLTQRQDERSTRIREWLYLKNLADSINTYHAIFSQTRYRRYFFTTFYIVTTLIDAILLLMMGTLLNDKEIIQTSADPK